MPDNVGTESKLTLSEVEDVVNDFAKKYAKSHYHLPDHAIRIILWPTDRFISRITRGPTAIIRLGILPQHPSFSNVVRDAIELVWRKKLWESMELELVARTRYNEDIMRRYRAERFGFFEEMVPGTLRAEEITVSYIERVEVSHRETKLREVVEFERGKGNTQTAREVARDRLARRVHALKMQKAIEENPFDLPPDHPDWVARTN